jgi:tetratricopeptide (TPR) repeat protein
MYAEDQQSRLESNIDWTLLTKQDKERENRIYELIKAGEINTGRDYYNSAMIFQHGVDTISSSMAIKYISKAIELDSTIDKWLLAAAIDRDLMKRTKPQIYGTQYQQILTEAGPTWKRYEIDSTQITDEQRKLFHVETLEKQLETERRMNLPSVSEFYIETLSIKKTLRLIKSAYHEGLSSKYNISENDINAFAYELMNMGQLKDALKIFILNAELHPRSFNTFDSLGECYFNLEKRKKGLKAYEKSIQLNPNNKNAQLMIEKEG